jgi:hypothetical protein
MEIPGTSVVASILIVMAYRGWDAYDKIEIFVKICFPGLFGVYEGLKKKRGSWNTMILERSKVNGNQYLNQ